MGAKGSRIAQQMGVAGNTDAKVAKLLQGLTYTPSDSRPHQILPEEADKVALLCFALFSAEECNAFISLTKDLEFKKGGQSLGIPMATNVTLKSKLIADLIWERISKFVPETIGEQKVKGIDSKVRFVKYDATDANSTKPQNWLAIGNHNLNAVIFLNDDYEGGDTVFHHEDEGQSNLNNFSGGVLIVEDKVKTQMLPISTGTKYIIRVGIEIDGECCDEMAAGPNETMHAVNIDDLLGAKVRRFTPAPRQLARTLPLGEQEDRPSLLLIEEFSLDRSECSRSPFADADEMQRGSFALSMEDDLLNTVVPDISDKKMEGFVTRCFSGRVDIDGFSVGKPSMDQYPSFKTFEGDEAEIVPSARRVISQPTHISHGTTEHSYPGFDALT